MPRRLEGKVALISGAARGQGASHARLFATEGAAVVLGDVLAEDADAIASELRSSGSSAEAIRLDVSRADDWAAAVALALERFGACMFSSTTPE